MQTNGGRSPRGRCRKSHLGSGCTNWHLGIKSNAGCPELPGCAIDIAFQRKYEVVFVNGCFWHACSEHRDIPICNREWWFEKIESNKKRDAGTAESWRNSGWLSLRFWEHDAPWEATDRVIAIVRKRPVSLKSTQVLSERL
ncbi:MAG: hypothetical protein KGZ68_08410 [Dechloromonas sp.]|nr:hypothetical protein [Dechloromonas sp.]